MEFIDTHCHLHFADYENPQQILAEAHKAGVKKIICVGVDLQDSLNAVNFAKNNPNVWATTGVHPHEASAFLAEQKNAVILAELLNEPKVVALGEVGLDYYKNYSSKTDQKNALRLQIEIGLKTKLPFVFHVRDAWEDFWQVFDDYEGIAGVIHSFSAEPEQLRDALDRRLYVAINGIMTFTKNTKQLDAAKQIPNDKLLIETDAPFLAPKPFRGHRCEPKHLVETAKFLTELRNESLESMAACTTENAQKLFNLNNKND